MVAASESGLIGVLVVYLLFLVGISVACGYGARSIMIGKGRSGANGFCLGFFLGLPGLLIAALLSPTPEHELRKQQQLMAMMGTMQRYQQPYMAQGGYPAQAGQWAADPLGRHQLRYHDGMRWTESVSNHGATGVDSPEARSVVAPAGQWAADPYQRHELRYFDGTNWTASVSNRGVTATDHPG